MTSKIILNIAEKPSVAKAISKILSGGNFQHGFTKSKFNPVQTFEYFFSKENTNVKMIVTSVSGHIMNYDYPKELKEWNINTSMRLFDVEPHKVIHSDSFTNNELIAENLNFHGSNSDTIILWLDCDREGENIAYEVLDIVSKSRGKRDLKVYRAHFSSLAERDIQNAMENLRKPNKSLSDAVDVRQKIDILTGFAFTVFQHKTFEAILSGYYKNTFDNNKKYVLSYGLCQIPTLNFVVKRCDEILSFQKDKFYYIEIILNKTLNNKSFDVKLDWEYDRVYDITAAYVYNSIIQEATEGEITLIKKKETYRYRPVPLNTVSFQKLVSSKLRISSDEAMKIAEDLYRKGFISYPRTETQVFSKNENLKKLISAQTDNPNWGVFASRLLNNEDNRYKGPRNGKQDDKSHPPIHPVKSLNASDVNEKTYRVYELITKYFLACVSCDAKGDETYIEYTIANQKFHTKGVVVTDKGFLEIYDYEYWNTKELPEFTLNEKLIPKSCLIQNGETSPPKLLSEKDLISLMDKNGIGTDATISEHIEKIVQRSYAYRERGYFKPSLIGYSLIHAYKHVGIEVYKPQIRSNMEKKLFKICEGVDDPKATYQEIKKKMESVFKAVIQKSDEMMSFMSKFVSENSNLESRLNSVLMSNQEGGGSDENSNTNTNMNNNYNKGNGKDYNNNNNNNNNTNKYNNYSKNNYNNTNSYSNSNNKYNKNTYSNNYSNNNNNNNYSNNYNNNNNNNYSNNKYKNYKPVSATETSIFSENSNANNQNAYKKYKDYKEYKDYRPNKTNNIDNNKPNKEDLPQQSNISSEEDSKEKAKRAKNPCSVCGKYKHGKNDECPGKKTRKKKNDDFFQ